MLTLSFMGEYIFIYLLPEVPVSRLTSSKNAEKDLGEGAFFAVATVRIPNLLFHTKITPMTVHGVKVLWEYLMRMASSFLDFSKASYLKRVLAFHRIAQYSCTSLSTLFYSSKDLYSTKKNSSTFPQLFLLMTYLQLSKESF